MIWICCWFSAMGFVTDAPTKIADNFFSQTVALQDKAWKLDDPVAIREYTTLLTEFYAQQYLFRAFAMRDMRGNEALWLERKQTDKNIQDPSQGMVEKNLEELLFKANTKFKDNIHIRFAIAQFLYRGRNLIPSPRLKLSSKEILNVFKEARSKNISSAVSLYVLALKDIPKDKKSAEVLQMLKKAHHQNPYDPDIMSVLSTQAITLEQWDVGARAARKLFEIAPTPEYKTEALVNIARVFHYKKNYEQAAIAINNCLDIQPRHAFAWNIGLDCLRSLKDSSKYQDLVNKFLMTNLNDPALFRSYLDYLKVRGTHLFDQTYLKNYAKTEFPTELAGMTQQTNLGNLHFQNKDFKTAKKHYEKARTIFDKIPNAPSQVASILDELIELSTKKGSK